MTFFRRTPPPLCEVAIAIHEPESEPRTVVGITTERESERLMRDWANHALRGIYALNVDGTPSRLAIRVEYITAIVDRPLEH